MKGIHKKQLETIGENIKVARKLRQLTQDDVADRARLSRATVINIEKGASVKTGSLIAVLGVIDLAGQLVDSIDLKNDDCGLALAKIQRSQSSKGGAPGEF